MTRPTRTRSRSRSWIEERAGFLRPCILSLMDGTPGYLELLESGELEERVRCLYALLVSCTVCPRNCGNNRLENVLASCASGADPVVSAFTPHFGEEPVLSGTRGAGNIF